MSKKLFISDFSKQDSKKNSDFQKPKKNNIGSENSLDKIVYTTKEGIKNFVKNYGKILVPITEIKGSNVDELIKEMKFKGVLHEPKPGVVMLL